MISNYVVDLSIFEKGHHNILFGKINICVTFHPSYVCEVWDYRLKVMLRVYKTLFRLLFG